MRIGIVTEYFYPTLGGVQEHVFHFARAARRQGHSVTVLTSHVPDMPSAPADVERHVIRIGRSMPIEANGSVGRVTVGMEVGKAISELLTERRFDIVHVHAPLSPVLPMLAVRRTALPVVGTYHTNFRRSLLMKAFRGPCQSLVDRIEANVAVSDACVRAVKPYVRANFRIIPNGVDCEFFENGRPQPWAMGGRIVLFIGRLERRCGLDRVINAWPLLEQRTAARLIVLGDGPERRRFESMAAAHNIPVMFFGPVREHRPDFFASADVLVCPTEIASFGVTLLEGMAAGLPIVASDIDGFREIVTNGKEGLLVDTANPLLLADTLADLLESPSRRRALGEAGRRTAATYDWPIVTSRVLNLYRELGVRS
jgi:phosphatidylinositol alpha-mannosyltransferase